ncbi:g patch domain-containing protein 1 [Caerostris darwini]|uniref:G patch domain-containing protein 1 n=1 Tax=Caerostris darwini TaxID=1538125 RepID=A0AAV4RCX8_9ARAC|nr:g patch domain-containing protein 1 [Caerostris darwini]
MEEDEDDYIFYGTPLPEIEEESVLRKKAARELEVRDEKGRQRFHGAFTGGFSAGYFNTVGTKEGWAPSTFVSSRENKYNDHKQQNPEDFMDEEDFGAHGIATRRIHTTSKFKDSFDSRTNKRKFSEVDNVIPGEAPLKDIVKPIKESIGIEILKKLGWKLGQGIGPRVKKMVPNVKVYGCSPFPEVIELEEDDPFAQSYTFAPEDTETELYKPKDNVFGLGYSGLSKDPVLSTHSDAFNPTTTKSWLKKDKKKLAISGQAFGVGAFEDDDEDIYTKDDMSQYDFSEMEPIKNSNAPDMKQQLDSLSIVLKGFCLASQPATVKKYYPPPELPHNYRPIHRTATKNIPQSNSKFKSRHSMSAEDRSLLIGEKKFQSFKLIAEKKAFIGKSDAENVNKNLPKNTHTFCPFPNDEFKQKRYEEYLRIKESGEIQKLVQPSSMTEWEKQQELVEFSRAAILFRPLSAALSSKFESRSHLDVEHEVMDAIAKAKKESIKKTEEKRKLIGKQNRNTFEWHPASLLCKRFNVPNPYPNAPDVSESQKSKSLFDHLSFENREAEGKKQLSNSKPKAIEIKIPDPVKKPVENSSEIVSTVASVEENIPVPLSETGRPPIDFFKDIFENSSDEEDLPETLTNVSKTPPVIEISKNEKESTTPVAEVTISNEKPVTTESKKVGFGVFANLDLDALNQRTPKVKTNSLDNTEIKCETMDISEKSEEENKSVPNISPETSGLSENLYGPELPPDYNESSLPSSSKYVSKKHAKHKHKHQKHKKKKKKKKHKSHKSSEESSFDSNEDIPPTVILEKLKKLQKVLK